MAILPLSSETMHSLVMKKTRIRCTYIPGYRRLLRMMFSSPSVPIEAFGIDFDNPVGLAAGMDKKGENIPNWENLGFGWIEICLLYTSPSPRDRQKSRMPSSA